MTITMPTTTVEGIQLTVTPFRPDAVIGTMGLPTLLQLVPSPRGEEDKRALKYASGAVRRHAEVRGLVQRMLKASQKGRNVSSYASYIAAGIGGGHGAAWSMPPITLWLDGQPGDARQIFYDRNVEGVPVAKNLAMSMDQRDIGTQLAHRVAATVKVEHDGKIIPFGKLVQSRKRQLTKADPEVVTLSALRVLVITALHGRGGLGLSSATVHEGELPEGVSAEQAERELVPLLSQLIGQLFPHFEARDAVSAPAVLAGLGIAAHQATSWASGGTRLNTEELLRLVEPVRFEREARYWDGVAASTNAAGTLNFGGGAKDSGGRVADALLGPDTDYGRKVRGW